MRGHRVLTHSLTPGTGLNVTMILKDTTALETPWFVTRRIEGADATATLNVRLTTVVDRSIARSSRGRKSFLCPVGWKT
jgi:hypothetical protein